MRTYIAGVGCYLPKRILATEDLEVQAGYKKFGLKVGLCQMLSGCKTRHFAADDEACSDLASMAGREALEKAGVKPNEVDAVLFCSVTQDFAEPATANVVACNLGISDGFAFDVKNACNAFLQGVDIADSLIKTGKAKTVLVVSGEVLSRWIKLNEYESTDDEELKHTAPVVLSMGDGAGAFVIKESKNDDRGIVASVFHTEPELWNNNVTWGGGVIYPREPEKMYIPGTTKGIIDCTGSNVQRVIPEVLELSGWSMNDVEYIVPTQGATWLANFIAKTLNVDSSRLINIVDHIGNVGASNIPIALYEAIEKGQLTKGSKAILTSGAVGMSYAAMTIVL